MNNRTEKIIGAAQKSAKEHSFFEKIPAFFRMVKQWFAGNYQPKKRNIYIAILALVYIIMPFDFDWVVLIGWVDDFAIFGFAFTRIIKEIDRFLEWENAKIKPDTIDIDLIEKN